MQKSPANGLRLFDIYLQLPQIEKQFTTHSKFYIKRKLKPICLLHFLASILSAYGVWYAAHKNILLIWGKETFVRLMHKGSANS